jgi:hypothetical protein
MTTLRAGSSTSRLNVRRSCKAKSRGLASRHWQSRPADDTSPSPILRRVAHQQRVAHRLEGFNLSAPILAAPSAEWGSPATS